MPWSHDAIAAAMRRIGVKNEAELLKRIDEMNKEREEEEKTMPTEDAIHLQNLTRSQNILIAVMRKLGVEKEGEVLKELDEMLEHIHTMEKRIEYGF